MRFGVWALYSSPYAATLYTKQYLPNFNDANILSILSIKFYLQN